MSHTSHADTRIGRFSELLDTHGADLERWPESDRSWAQRLCNESPDAVELLAQAKRLDAWLDQAPAIAPSPALRRAVAELPLRHPHASRAHGWSFGKLWKPVVAAALVGALGVAVGVATIDSQTGSEDDGLWSDYSGLVFASDLDREVAP